MIDADVKRKIQKLLALGGNNDSVQEANNALKKAALLAEEYGLALSDIDKDTGKVKQVDRTNIILQNQNQKWVIILAAKIARCFESELITGYTRSSETGFKKKKVLHFLGTPSDMEMVMWYFKFIKIRIMRQMSEKYTSSIDQKTYALGAVQALGMRLTEMFIKPREDARNKQVRDLVIVKDKAIAAEIKSQFGKITTKSLNTGQISGRDVYDHGMKDGRNMSLHRGHIAA